MPLYEYQCDACSHRFEVIQKYSDAPVDVCPKCGGTVRKLLSSPAIQFKGSGWYITDYARAGKSDGGSSTGKSEKAEGGASGSSDSKASSGESRSETKGESKGDSKGESKSDSKGDSKSDSKSESKPSSPSTS
jgi:putative FmdB family regulatory protein